MIDRYENNNKVLIKIMDKIIYKLENNKDIIIEMSPVDLDYSYSLYFYKKEHEYCFNLKTYNDKTIYIKVFYKKKSDVEWGVIK